MLEALKTMTNAPRTFSFAGKDYEVRNASLEKIGQFQTRFDELTKAQDPALQVKVSAYCLFLILKDATPAIPEITEEWVAKNTPDVEMADVLEEFAFMNRQKVEKLRAFLNGTQRNAPDQKEPAGPSSSQ